MLSVFLCVSGVTVMLYSAEKTDQGKAKPANSRLFAVEDVLDISTVPASFPVGFCLLTHERLQYVAYYDADRNMTVACRQPDSRKWEYKVLPSKVGRDSHNYIAMAVDQQGHLHVSGNMHCVPLIYFRTQKVGEISTLKKRRMNGYLEESVTYPRFMQGSFSELIFSYRSGSSGNGVDIFKVYDHTKQVWRNLIDTPLVDGISTGMSGYRSGPVKGPDGLYHMAIVWRDTPDCATCHDISYVRSPDLKTWENARGEPVKLPITYKSKGIVVDPVPVKGGLINMGFGVGFDHRKRPIVFYTKYDKKGNSQIYNARLEEKKWKIYQTSDWSRRWAFEGGGFIACEIRASGVRVRPKGVLIQTYWNETQGNGVWRLAPRTLKPTGQYVNRNAKIIPPHLQKPESGFPGMQVRWSHDRGKPLRRGVQYRIRWETLGPNRDHPRSGKQPAPSMLRLYQFRK